ncbi:fimbrial protein pilin [Candidatus Saccharibacteria bacterium RAAC3_TM7_1]|nr:fimbrial protein pilin [Candidatus Saccharibacteria bacterium RAAC3_TM7_1]HCZ28389.1 prepilin-type N-terminal cleavage/methylation domain-containing protein [Candidatus Saccharibacteria bacterium]
MVTQKRGFTIVELLIVIVVVAILAAITIVVYNGIQQRARDTQRVADMRDLKQQIEVYYIDNGSYPTCSGTDGCYSTSTNTLYRITAMPINSASKFVDPTNTDTQYGYYYTRRYKKTGATTFTNTGNINDYIIATRLESKGAPYFSAWNNTNLNYLDGN